MFIIYDLIFLIIAVIYLPVYLLKRKFHRGFFLRLGILPKGLKLNRPIWIHAVSVGEAMAIKGLIDGIRKLYPERNLVISTVTPTGNKIVRDIARETDLVTYLPLDLSFIVSSVIRRIKPSLAVIAETELWPNFISCLHDKHIPILVVNARISDKSFRGYMAIKFLLKSILNKIDMFCAQTDFDARRLARLGVSQGRIRVTGNMKFDIKDYREVKTDYADYKKVLGLDSKDKFLVAGSTHPGEEEIILSVYRNLLKDFSDLKMLIAPRRPERSKEVQKIAEKFGFKSIFISTLNPEAEGRQVSGSIFILDSVGQLMNYYAIADIVFVGGSLIKKGGHNILEPASLSKPIIFGPYMFNFRDIADLFVKQQACILIRDGKELETQLRGLLNNPYKMEELGRIARDLIARNQGATLKNLECIHAKLPV